MTDTRRRVIEAISSRSLTARCELNDELASTHRRAEQQSRGAEERDIDVHASHGENNSLNDSAHVASGEESTGESSFRHYCNSRRIMGDMAVLFMRLAVGVAAFTRFRALYSTSDVVIVACCGAVAVGCPVWATLAPDSYTRWREPAMSAVRLLIQGQPIIPAIAVHSLRGSLPWQHSSRLAGSEFVRSFLHVPMSLGVMGPIQWALASRLPLPLHAGVHAVLIMISYRRAALLCACTTMHSWQSSMHRLFTAADLLSFPWVWVTATSRPPAVLSPESECWVLSTAVQIMVGYVLPTVVVAVWECRDFQRFRAATRGRYQSDWRTWLYEHTTAAPVEGGWVRGCKLALMSWSLFGIVWDILKCLAPQHA